MGFPGIIDSGLDLLPMEGKLIKQEKPLGFSQLSEVTARCSAYLTDQGRVLRVFLKA